MTLGFQDSSFDVSKGVTSEYILPVATTTTLGGVMVDGDTININDGVISASAPITVDSALNSTSENPVQNKVLYPSLSGYIPSGTVISVKTDGTGDFTTLSDAVSSLVGKWSNGTVTISLGNGTFTESSGITLNGSYFSIPLIVITGQGKANTTVSYTGSTSNFIDIYRCSVDVSQMAIARASAVSSGFGTAARCKKRLVIS